MKHYEDYQVTSTRQRLTGVTCDRCGAEILRNGVYEVREFELRVKIGSSYPEGGSGAEWEVEDLCDNCIAHLKELLKQNGYKVIDRDWDW